MKFTINEKIFKKFPGTEMAVVVARGVDNFSQTKETKEYLDQEVMIAQSIFSEIKPQDHENVQAWRKAYTQFGGTSKYRCSIEALLKRVSKGKGLPSINPLVNIYNAISIKHVMPVGGEDISQIKGNVELREATGEESFVALGETENDPPKQGEVIYVDSANEVLCRRWNWREADKTKLQTETKDAILVVEALPPVKTIELKEAAIDLAQQVEKYTGAKTEMFLVNENYNEVFVNDEVLKDNEDIA